MSDEPTVSEIEALALEIIDSGGVDCGSEAKERMVANEYRLDVLVGSLYGFTESEVRQIQDLLPPYETVYGVTKP